ncbi:MAG: phage minor head protein [Alphaproteobacteria bacterium]|nr:phage minor head protein [Alphaproteobacteria bacterium]
MNGCRFPKEQSDFLRNKIALPSERRDSIDKSAHDRGFIVAGAKKADLLQDLHNKVDKYVREGSSWQNFKRDFKQIVTDHGWHSWTGEGTTAGENWRTRIILETNIRSSYAAGRWQQQQAVKSELPEWEYIHNDGVLHPRPQHKQWGDSHLCLPADHEFWKTHYPPNGWRRRCRVRARFKAAAGSATTPPEGWDRKDPKTGEPPGIDKGWGYAPGSNTNQSLEDAVAKKLIKYEPAIRKAMEHHLAQI